MLGFSPDTWKALEWWLHRWEDFSSKPIPPLPPPKVFSPKFNLPILEDYRKDAPSSYWDAFPKNFSFPAKSFVNHVKLRELALDCGFKNLALLDLICTELEFGADIGCTGEYRRPGTASNAPSAYENGQKVSDAIADWCSKGFVLGPLPDREVPKEAKFNGIMTRSKPNGSVRIILNLSAPVGSSVNEGINSDDFPATMSSTTKWLEALWTAGKGCLIMKSDWSDAYKHCNIRKEDINLQWFKWCGMNFAELCAVFGCVSSAGIFDRLAKLVLFIVRTRAGMPANLICQHLDDVVACAPADSVLLQKFDAEFSLVADLLGVRLAPRADPDKSFAPCTRGVVFGVLYDTTAWTWGIPAEKLCRLQHALQDAITADFVTQQEIWSIAGKILHVRPLVPNGKFNIFFILKAQRFSDDPATRVPITAGLRRQLTFWLHMLPVCSGVASIPNPSVDLPPWAVQVYTDAAGGSPSGGRGAGAVAAGFWLYLPWSPAINQGRPAPNGRQLDRVMSALELVGPLAALCGAADRLRGLPVIFWVDNIGSVYIYQKGYSTSCDLSSTLVSAIADVAAGLGCRVQVKKILRCSSPLASMADALSKADMPRFWATAAEHGGYGLPFEPLPVPLELLRWVRAPALDFDLGRRLLAELATKGSVLGF